MPGGFEPAQADLCREHRQRVEHDGQRRDRSGDAVRIGKEALDGRRHGGRHVCIQVDPRQGDDVRGQERGGDERQAQRHLERERHAGERSGGNVRPTALGFTCVYHHGGRK